MGNLIIVLSVSLVCVSLFAIQALFVIDKLRTEKEKQRIMLLSKQLSEKINNESNEQQEGVTMSATPGQRPRNKPKRNKLGQFSK